MSEQILIHGGRVIDPHHHLDAHLDVYVADGRIAALVPPGESAPIGLAPTRRIHARGLIVSPGFIDLSARLSPLEKELAAAVAGGVTGVVCQPDLNPILDEPGLVERLVHRTRDAGLARVHPLGALTRSLKGEQLSALGSLVKAGCIAFSQAQRGIADTQALRRAMEYAATFDYGVWLHPQDVHLARGGVAHNGEVASRLGLVPVPVSAETVALSTFLLLARETGVRLHCSQLSSAAAVAILRDARARGQAVTADVGIHHLHLIDEDIGFFDSLARFDPPLRAASDRESLREALASGLITAAASGHIPVDEDGKLLPFGEADPGATGLELLLPLTLRWAEEEGVSYSEALARITCDAAAVAGVAGGHLAVGAVADLCLFDPAATWVVGADTLVSEGKNTPFLGQTLTGRVQQTLVGGQTVYQAAAVNPA